MNIPDKNKALPLEHHKKLCFLKNIITNSNIILGGNPAKLIENCFSDKTISNLLEIKWWDWDIERITANVQNLTGKNFADIT
jgi:hypothetical protein